MKIYTKTGDRGTTSLIGGERVSKSDARVVAYGTVDELMAHLGYLHDKLVAFKAEDCNITHIVVVLRTLMDVSEILATSLSSPYPKKEISEQSISALESEIDRINSSLEPLCDFTLPCGHELLSLAHVCRTISRRAEREIIAVESVPENVLSYINRLSDYLYILGRGLSKEFNVKEILRNA